MSSEIHSLFVILKHGDINGRLAAHGGKLLVILDNYTRVYPELPETPADENTHIFGIEVADDDLAIDKQDGGDQWRIWIGDKGSRSRPGEKCSATIYSLKPMANAPQAALADPKEAAAILFDGLPDKVKLAASIAAVPVQTLVDLQDVGDVIAARLKTWATETLTAYGTEQARG